MKHIKLFEQFKNHQEIDEICTKYKIKNYTINDDLSIDVEGDVELYFSFLTEIPLKFRNVTGYFNCYYNNLTSLKGAPSSVGGGFHCSDNSLTSLEGAPRTVGGNFNCNDNHLKTLYGVPSSVGGHFDCSHNPLYSFDYLPDFIGDYLYLSDNLNYIFDLFNDDINLIDSFNDYNIIKAPKNIDDKPRLKVSNLNSFLTDNGFKELEDTSELEKYYDLK